jgi:stage II sporulation protein AA (anti-sigma F factor antagonist)
MMTIASEPGSPVCIAHFTGDLDFSTVPEMRSGLDDVISAGCTSVVLDFVDVTYADSSALGLLVWVDKQLQTANGKVVIAGANSDVSRVLELSGLIGMAPCVSAASSVDDAVEGLAAIPEGGEPLWVGGFEARAELGNMSEMRTRIVEMVAPCGLPEAGVFDLKVAVGEALANAVRHGSPGGSADTIAVEVRAFPDRVEVRVSDHGVGFKGDAVCTPDTFASSGRGVIFMRALMDKVEFMRCDGHGTMVRLVKRLPAVTADFVSRN